MSPRSQYLSTAHARGDDSARQARRAFGSASALNSSCTTSVWPQMTAQCSGVVPRCSKAHGYCEFQFSSTFETTVHNQNLHVTQE